MFKYFIIIAATTLFTGTVSAQSVASGFYLSGNVQSEHIFDDNNTFAVGIVDFTLGFDGSASGTIPFGFEIDMIAINGDSLTVDPIFTGSVFYESSLGRVSVGMPRVARDDYCNCKHEWLKTIKL